MPDQELEERKPGPSEEAASAPLTPTAPATPRRSRRDELAAQSTNHDNLAKTTEPEAESLDALATRLASDGDRQHDLFAADETIKIDTRASSELSVGKILNPPAIPPSGKLSKPDLTIQKNRIAEATNNIVQVTQMFTAGIGGLVAGPKTGSTLSAAFTAAQLDRIRHSADYINTVQANQTALVQAAGGVDLIAELVHHGIIPENTEPKKALATASNFLADLAEIHKMMAHKKGELLQIELEEVLARDIKIWTNLSRASGALMIAPVTGVAGELAAIPGVVIEAFGVGLAHALKETVREAATIPADVTSAFFFAPLFAFFKSMDQINTRYLTPESAIGGLTLTAGLAAETGLLLTHEELRSAGPILGLFVLSLCAATSVSLTVGMIRHGRSGSFTSEYENERKKRAQGPIPVTQTGPDEHIIEGKFRDVTDEKEKTEVKK